MFKIGDRVRVIRDYCAARKGDKGIIRALPNHNGSAGYSECYSVEFPLWSHGHDCRGTVPSGHGLWVVPECLELIKPKSEKIFITHDGKTTLARLYEDNKVVKSAEAKCDPRDEFNFAAGAKIAFERLTGEEKKEPPSKVGDTVKITSKAYYNLSYGTIGEVVNVSKSYVEVRAYSSRTGSVIDEWIDFKDCEKVK